MNVIYQKKKKKKLKSCQQKSTKIVRIRKHTDTYRKCKSREEMTEEAAATQGTESSVREERKIHSRRSVTLPRRWEYFSDPKLTSSAQNAVHEVRLKMCSIRTRGKVGVP